MSHILHITTTTAWESAQRMGEYRADSLQTEGFIHLSTPEQVLWVANSRFRGHPSLVLLVVDPARVRAEVRWEPPSDSDRAWLFPHIYGPITLDAVVRVVPFPPGPDGLFSLPVGV